MAMFGRGPSESDGMKDGRAGLHNASIPRAQVEATEGPTDTFTSRLQAIRDGGARQVVIVIGNSSAVSDDDILYLIELECREYAEANQLDVAAVYRE